MTEFVFYAARILVWMMYAYLACGFVFAIWFVGKGAKRLDEGLIDLPWTTKWVFMPGSILLWVFLLKKTREIQKIKNLDMGANAEKTKTGKPI